MNFFSALHFALIFSVTFVSVKAEAKENEQVFEIYAFEKSEFVSCARLFELNEENFSQIVPVAIEKAKDFTSSNKINFLLSQLPADKNIVLFVRLLNFADKSLVSHACNETTITKRGKRLDTHLHLKSAKTIYGTNA